MINSTDKLTFLFHDYETFGNSPALDRPAQFAAIRTDVNLNILDDPTVFYCKLADDYLPNPNAVLVTGITPQEACAKGVHEAEFARRIHDLFNVPNTCVVGYNNIRFDDEITRNILYRNLYDPYSWSWKNCNSRWDLLDVMRACYALRPNGISWSENETGLPSFRLEHLTKENEIEHNETHNAVADVYATIAIARLVKKKQPNLFNYLFRYRNKKKLLHLINISQMRPLVHISSVFGLRRRNTSLVVPLAWHPENRNIVIAADLAGDVRSLLEMKSDALDTLHLHAHFLERNARNPQIAPIKLIHLNQCPVLAQANTLRPEDAKRLGINRQQCLDNLRLLHKNPQIRRKVENICIKSKPFHSSAHVDTQLYNGFFSSEDRAALKIVQKTNPKNLPALNITFTDQRIKKLIFNYRARNFPNTLDEFEQEQWLQHRRDVFTHQFLLSYTEELERLYLQYEEDNRKKNLLRALWQYAQEIL